MDCVLISILDPHEVVVAGLGTVLDSPPTRYRVVPLVGGEKPPDVVLYGVPDDPDTHHDPQLHALVRSGPATVIATYWDDRSPAIKTALACGARGVLTKRLSAAELRQGIQRMIEQQEPRPRPPEDSRCDPEVGRVGLTPRELDVVGHVAVGLSNQEIADRLYLSINSVKTYIRNAYRKIGIERRSQAVIWGQRHGIIWRASGGPETLDDTGVDSAALDEESSAHERVAQRGGPSSLSAHPAG
ncbi:response regulator transcription factor [Nocardioides sp. GXQ0305]|uniref:helix-turn-helix transcriptional regulator n=1 Tax=Nocardioides sp. GXQ0305 TaxID=3423912 RepID=UPI003D7D7022